MRVNPVSLPRPASIASLILSEFLTNARNKPPTNAPLKKISIFSIVCRELFALVNVPAILSLLAAQRSSFE
jgi:hypothetical protein